MVAAWDSFKRYFAPRAAADGVSSGGESGDSDACSESGGNESPKREYFEKAANSLFSGVNTPFRDPIQ